MNLDTILVGVIVMALGGWATAIRMALRCAPLRAQAAAAEDTLAKLRARTPVELRAEADRIEREDWQRVAGRFQGAVADARKRIDEAPMPAVCVYDGCDEEPTTKHVDGGGLVAGLCERHARTWGRLDEDGRRRVRMGGA